MTRDEARAFVESLLNLRTSATDEQALDATAVYPTWKEGVLYLVGSRLLHNNILYIVLQEHISQADWTPDVSPSLFAKVLIPNENVIPEWEQPDSTNAYMTGDKVMRNGKVWESDIDNNVWKPEEYGWHVVEVQ